MLLYPYFDIHSTRHCALCHLLSSDENYSFDCSASGVVLGQQFVFLIFWALSYIFLLLCRVLSRCVFVAYDVSFDRLSYVQCV
jgi:hypothetical protein